MECFIDSIVCFSPLRFWTTWISLLSLLCVQTAHETSPASPSISSLDQGGDEIELKSHNEPKGDTRAQRHGEYQVQRHSTLCQYGHRQYQERKVLILTKTEKRFILNFDEYIGIGLACNGGDPEWSENQWQYHSPQLPMSRSALDHNAQTIRFNPSSHFGE